MSAPGEAAFAAAFARISDRYPELPSLETGMLAALDLGLPGDSRAFARTFGVEHALVMRALAGLAELGHVTVLGRDPRTQRTRYASAVAPAS